MTSLLSWYTIQLVIKRKRKMVAGEYNCFVLVVIICPFNANTKSKVMTLGLYFLQRAGVQFAKWE